MEWKIIHEAEPFFLKAVKAFEQESPEYRDPVALGVVLGEPRSNVACREKIRRSAVLPDAVVKCPHRRVGTVARGASR